jgi:chemotaxis signal transduction protein
MSDETLRDLRGKLERFRADFDASFARAATTPPPHQVDLLCVDVCGASFAVDSSRIAGVHATHGLTRPPSSVVEFLGVVQLRGRPLAVFDLARLCRRTDDGRQRRYFMVLSGTPLLGLAFTNVERQVRTLQERLVERANIENSSSRSWLDQGREVPVLEVSTLRERIAHASASTRRRK